MAASFDLEVIEISPIELGDNFGARSPVPVDYVDKSRNDSLDGRALVTWQKWS